MKVRLGLIAAGAVAAMFGAGVALAVPQQQISDETVKKYMDWAWQQLPDRFTEPDGEVITFDKKKKETILVPLETGRDVVIAAWRSVRAQACNLPEEQVANFESLKARENVKKKWTKQQLKYMMILHLTVLQLNTGKVKVTVKDGETVLSEEELPSKALKPCTDAEREKVRELITAYVNSGPPLPAAPEAQPAGAAKAAAGAPAAKAKK